MAYSYVEYVGTGGGTIGPFYYGSVALLDSAVATVEDQLEVYKDGVLLTGGGTDYTIDELNEEIDLVSPLYNTNTLRIARATKKDARYVDYEDSTNVTSELLDLDSNQLFYIVQEAFDLQTDAMTRGSNGQWNGRGYRITNLASAVDGTDAVNLNQLQAATSGALPANLSGLGTAVFTGDGVTGGFTLPAAISTITDTSDVMVHINGIRQLPTTHYTISGGILTIGSVPGSGDKILLTWPEGVVSATLTSNSVTTSSIQDDAVTVAKIAQGTNGQVLATVSSNTAWTNIDSTYISNFDTQVRTSRLDQMAAPTASVSLNSNKITNLAVPTVSTDAATKSYVDSQVYSSTHNATCTGTATSVSFSATTTFTVGQFTIQVPIQQNGNILYMTCTGVTSSTITENPDRPIRVFLSDEDVNVGSRFSVYFTRSGGSGNTVSFTVTRNDSHNVVNALDLVNTGTAFVCFTKGSS